MFEKKEIIFSEAMGVCQVAELTKLSAKSGEQVLYYGLRSISDKKKVSYTDTFSHYISKFAKDNDMELDFTSPGWISEEKLRKNLTQTASVSV